MNCPDENALVAMIEQALDPARVSELEVHFDSCAKCCDMIAALAGTRPTPVGTPQGRWVHHALGLADDLPPPEKIGGRYEVRELLGRGGMGAVYLARDITLDRDVALKLHRAGSGDERLQREALSMAKLAHPNVVTVFEIGSVDDRLFVAMEYVRGATLRGWLTTPRSWREVVALLYRIGDGLAAAHAAGLIHRDFKPENVLVGEDGRPRVGDFGLARSGPARLSERALPPRALGPPGAPALGTPAPEAIRVASDHVHRVEHAIGTPAPVDDPDLPLAATALGTPNATAAGVVVGTPAYMAPEQFAGQALDARCDQFAFSVVAWECLYGRRPFAGATSAAIQIAIEQRELQRPARSDVPDRVRRVLERGLATEPANRFPDLRALLDALRAAAASRVKLWIAVGAAAAATIAVATTLLVIGIGDMRREQACDASASDVRRLYNTERRAAVQRGLAATKAPFADAAFDRTTRVLEQYVDALAGEVAATCLGRDEAPAITEARRACLAERASQLGALVEALASADPALVLRAPGAAWAIFDPRPCHEPRPNAGPPTAPEHVVAVGKLRGLVDTGRYTDAVAAAAPLLDGAKQRGDRATELSVLLELGEAHASLDAVTSAVPVLHRAQALAEALGRDLEAANALNKLANIAGVTQHDYPAAHRFVDLARAKLDRLGDGNLVARARLLATEAQVLVDEYRVAEAEPAIRRAVQLLEQAYGIDTPELGSAVAIASQVARSLGKRDEAHVLSVRALKILDGALGSHHPTVAGAHLNLAQSLIEAERFPEARDKLLAADAVFAAVFGSDHPVRAAVAGNLGEVEQRLGNHDAAIAAFKNAVGVLERTEGPKAVSAGAARRDLARTIGVAGRTDEALRELALAITIFEEAGTDGVGRLRGALVERAQLQLLLGQHALAIVAAERALAVATKHPETTLPAELADTKFTLARALVKQDRARALALAREAATIAEPEQRAEIETFLKS